MVRYLTNMSDTEFIDHDVEATLKTMFKEPYVHNVATLKGGNGYKGVYDFYKNHFVGKMRQDTTGTKVSRTKGKDEVVEELLISFTHDRQIDFMLPGIPPTGKFVQLPHVVVMKFKGNKIAHEHIYRDQGSLLDQVDLLDSNKVPVVGVEQAKVLISLQGR